MRYAVLLVLKILLAIIGIMLLLLLLPVHLRATFNGDLKVSAGVLFINFKLYPRPPVSEKKRLKKERREQKRKKKERKRLSEAEEELQVEGVWALVKYYIEMGKLITSTAKRLLKTITVDRLNLNIVVATDDAARTAIDYGKICAVVYPIQALIESTMRVRRREINISTDFLLESGVLEGDIKIHVLPICVLWQALLFFIDYTGNNKDTALEKIPQR
mgnify:FL=1